VVIVLGVAAIVAIRHITVHSEQAVAGQLSDLGANILVLPKDASLEDYYSADLNKGTIPEEHAATVLLSGLTGVERLSPKLSVPGKLRDQDVTITGILPQSEFEANAAWQTAALFGAAPKEHVGCTRANCAPDPNAGTPQSLATLRSIEKLGPRETILGADAARRTGLVEGETVNLLGEPFQILAVLPRTGTIDDSRVFAHLHSIQDLSGSGPVVNAIEVMGCCEDAAGDLVPQLESLLPDTRIVTISQVVATQVNVNRMMSQTSWFVLAISALVGGASLAGTVAANVRERRKEIGTLMAMGATPLFVARLFLLKAGWLGFAGGGLGCLLGIGLAIGMGPAWAGLSIRPLVGYSLLVVVGATLVALAAALIPARRAARIDPCVCFQEV
jgi:putative ABC transport system permease protein